MAFNSIEFVFFIFFFLLAYFFLPKKYQRITLLVASLAFYSTFKIGDLLLVIILIFLNYSFGKNLAEKDIKKRRFLLFLFAGFNLFILVGYKIINQIGPWQTAVFSSFPLGLSFLCFQLVSYLVEVYQRSIPPVNNILLFSLSILYFPKIASGPIEKPQHFLPQLAATYNFDYERVTSGMKMVLWGFFKKVVIADQLAPVVSSVFTTPQQFYGAPLLIAAVVFSIQLYCDFSGFIDIARGISHIIGIRLTENFSAPYLSTSITNFWRRWHVSLMRWFREYVYFPLGGSRKGKIITYRNIVIIFVFSALWHGWGLTFLVWGLIHAAFLIGERITGISEKTASWSVRHRVLSYLVKTIQWLGTFTIVTIGWIFFRASNLEDAKYFLLAMFKGSTFIATQLAQLRVPDVTGYIFQQGFALTQNNWILMVSLFSISWIVIVIEQRGDFWKFISNKPLLVRWAVYYGFLFSILFSLQSAAPTFLYFKF